MNEEQLQLLWNLHAKNAGFKDIGEFKTLMQNENARKVYFDNSNKQLGFKDYNYFNLTLQKKSPTQTSSTESSNGGVISPGDALIKMRADKLVKEGDQQFHSAVDDYVKQNHIVVPDKTASQPEVDAYNQKIKGLNAFQEKLSKQIGESVNKKIGDEVETVNNFYSNRQKTQEAYLEKRLPVVGQLRNDFNTKVKALTEKNNQKIEEYKKTNPGKEELKQFVTKQQQSLDKSIEPEYQKLRGTISQLQQDPDFAKGFQENYQQGRSMPTQFPLTEAVRKGVTGALDVVTGGLATSRAASLPVDFDEYLTKRGDYRGSIQASPEEAKKEYIDTFGQAKYDEEKKAYVNMRVAQKESLMKYAKQKEGSLTGSQYQLPSTWEEAKQKGGVGITEYIGKNAGQTIGLAAPTIAASFLHPYLGYAIGAGIAVAVEKGEAYNKGIDLFQQNTGLSRKELFAKDADSLLRDTSTRSGLINGAFEFISEISMVGKFLPKGVLPKVFSNVIKNAGVQIPVSMLIEGSTEWIQAIDTDYAALTGSGKTHDEAMKVIEENIDKGAYNEDFMAGLAGAGGLGVASGVHSLKEGLERSAKYKEITQQRAQRPEVNPVTDEQTTNQNQPESSSSGQENTATLPLTRSSETDSPAAATASEPVIPTTKEGLKDNIHSLAKEIGVDINTKEFKAISKDITGLSHLDKMNSKSLGKVLSYLQEQKTLKGNEVSQQIPSGERTEQNEGDRRVEEISTAIKGSLSETVRDAQTADRTLSREEEIDNQDRAAEKMAKENQMWLPIDKVSYLGEPMPSGNENEVFLTDGKVFKVNNLTNHQGSILSFLDYVKKHNELFPSSKYEVVGFTGRDGGKIFPVTKQDHVDSDQHATPDEIDSYMGNLGFTKVGDGSFTNGKLTVSDLHPRNVLKSDKGNIFVVDDIIKESSPLEVANHTAKENGFDHASHLLNSVEKNTGQKFENVQDVPKETLDQVVKERAGKGKKPLSVIERTTDEVKSLIKETFDGTYDPQSNIETVDKAHEFIQKVGGIENAFKYRNDIDDVVKRVVYVEYMHHLEDSFDSDPANRTLYRNAMIELAQLAKVAGQATQIMDYLYQQYGTLFTYENQVQKFADNTKDSKVPQEIRALFKELAEKHKALVEETAKLEKERQEHEDKVALYNIIQANNRDGNVKRQRAQQTIKEARTAREKLKKDYARTLRGGALQASIIPGLTAEQLTIAVKIAKTYLDEFQGNLEIALDKTKELLKEITGKSLTDEQLDAIRKSVEPIWEINGVNMPHRMIRDLVAQGYDTIEKLTPKVQEILKDKHPNLTERQVRDIISGYGRMVNPSSEEIETVIRKIKLAGRLKSQLEDVLGGTRPLKSGQQREKPTAEERAKIRQISQLLKELPLDEATADNELKSAIDRITARLKNRKDDLELALSKGEKITNKNTALTNSEIKDLKQEVKEAQEIYDTVFDKGNNTEKTDRAIKALYTAVDKMADRIQNIEDEIFTAKKDKAQSQDITDLKERLKRMKEFREFLLEESGIAELKRLHLLIANAEKTEQRMKEAIRTGNFSRRKVKENYLGYNFAVDEAELILQKEKLKSAETAEQRKAIQLNIDVLTKKLESTRALVKKRGELQGVRDEFIHAQHTQQLNNLKTEEKAVNVILDVIFSMTRGLKAGFDLSMAMIQLMIPNMYFARQDVKEIGRQVAKGNFKLSNFKSQTKQHFSQAFKALGSAKAHAKQTLDLGQHDDYQLAKDVGLRVSMNDPKLKAEEEALMFAAFSKIAGLPNKGIGHLLEKIGFKKLGEWVKGSNVPESFERASHALGNAVRLQRFSELASRLRKEGKSPLTHREEYKKIAKYVNDSSGQASLGFLDQISKRLALLLFSARLIAQSLKYVTPYAFVHYYKLGNSNQSFGHRINPLQASQAQKAFMTDFTYAIGIQYMIMQSVVAAANLGIDDDDDKWSIEHDPRSSSFMQIRIPGDNGNVTYVEPWGPYRTMIVFMARMSPEFLGGNKMIRRNGETVNLGEGTTPSRWNLAVDFGLNKLAPTPAFVQDYLDLRKKMDDESGTYTISDKYNNEYEFDKEVASLTIPMYFSTISKGFEANSPALAAGLTALAFFGVGVNTYDETPKEEK